VFSKPNWLNQNTSGNETILKNLKKRRKRNAKTKAAKTDNKPKEKAKKKQAHQRPVQS
jgi:hypothetical protein